ALRGRAGPSRRTRPGTGLLRDLAGAVHDHRPRHVRARHAARVWRRERLRRPPRALPDGDTGRGRPAPARRGPASPRAVPPPAPALSRFRGVPGARPPRGRQAVLLARAAHRRGAADDPTTARPLGSIKMGAQKWPPTPQRSERPGKAVTLLDIPSMRP